MSVPLALIAAWARSAVVPRDGAFRSLQMHQIAEPVLQSVLQRAGLDVAAVDAVILGNALGAGGNPARMLTLAAGLPERQLERPAGRPVGKFQTAAAAHVKLRRARA